MIAHLTGTVTAVGPTWVVLDLGGFGVKALCTPATAAAVRLDQPTTLQTSLVVREDSLTLYGFADADERSLFETATSVTGVGPRTALALLAVHTPDAIRRAVHTQDVKAFTRVPGIGPKGAQRIVLELSGKLAPPAGDGATAAAGAPAAVAGDQREKVVEALVGLGYQQKVADDAVGRVLAESGAESVTEAEVAATLRAVLRSLGGRRG